MLMEKWSIKLELLFLIKLLWRSRLKFRNMYVGDYQRQSLLLIRYGISICMQLEYFDLFIGWIFRAGHKLEAAIEQLEVDVTGKVALDSGLSTGGFTDCLLQYGASFVYGVDVGYGQV